MKRNKVKKILLCALYEDFEFGNLQFFNTGIPESILQLAKEEGLELDRRKDEPLFREVFWELLCKNIVVPGNRTNSAEFPWASLTEYGKKCFEEDRLLPLDPQEILRSLYDAIPDIDPIIKIYFEESVSCFDNMNYLSSTVMIGGALERAIIVKTESFYNELNDNKAEFQNNILNISRIKTKFDNFIRFLKESDIYNDFSLSVKEKLSSLLPAIFNLIRITRNETGHPTGREISRDEAEANILLAKEGIQFLFRDLVKS